MSNVKDRLRSFIKSQKITIKSFEKSIGAGNGYVNSIVSSIGATYLTKIETTYPMLNRNWLLFGEGDMLKPTGEGVNDVGVPRSAMKEELVEVRFFEVSPSATFQEYCAGVSEQPSTIGVVPADGEQLDSTYSVFEITGESMAPQIQPHARVLCREIPPSRWHTIGTGIVVIAYADRFVIKRLQANRLATDSYLILSSDNPAFPSRETVQLADIRAIFLARRIITSPIY